MLKQMKKNGFAQGGTIGELIKSSGEDGFVLARTGEEILSLDKIKELKYAFSYIDPIVDNIKNMTTPNLSILDSVRPISYEISIGDIQMHGVNNPSEFAQQLKDSIKNNKSVRESLQDVTLGEALGRNSLNRYTR